MPGATALVIANGSEAIQNLSSSDADPENIEKRRVAAKQLKLIKEKFDNAAAWAFRFGKKEITPQDLRAPEVRPLIHVINNALLGGVNPHISQTMPPEMARKLREDVFIFSGAKTYAELKQVGDLLTNDKGFVKPFDEFTRDVQRVHETYNLNYLQAEYIYATQSAQMASNWQQIEEDGDRYLLQYRTVGDDRVRYEHQLLDGITLPPSDPFWAEYYPPNGWRCRCTAVQVLKTSYDKTDPKQAMELGKGAIKDRDKIFRMNPGKQAVIFPEKHPYYNVLGKEGKDVVKEILEEEQEEETWSEIKTANGKVMQSSRQTEQERLENADIATYLANKYGYEIDLIGVRDGIPTADSFNKTLNIYQEYKVNTTATKSSIDNLIRSAETQANHVVLVIESDISDRDLRNGIKGRVSQRQKDSQKTIQSVTVIKNGEDKTYTYDQIIQKDWEL